MVWHRVTYIFSSDHLITYGFKSIVLLPDHKTILNSSISLISETKKMSIHRKTKSTFRNISITILL